MILMILMKEELTIVYRNHTHMTIVYRNHMHMTIVSRENIYHLYHHHLWSMMESGTHNLRSMMVVEEGGGTLRGIVLYYIILYYIILYYIILYCIVLYCIILYILYYIVFK